MTTTSIEWTDRVWNPVTGCTKVSAGCKHCYAERVADRFWPTQYVHTVGRGFIPARDYQADAMDGRIRTFTDVMTHADRLLEPLRWRKPARVFVNSMSDLFHEDVSDWFIERVFSVMALAERHTFQVLTKRPKRMLDWFSARRFDVAGAAILQTEPGECHYAFPWPLRNVWLGVSCEDQQRADERIPLLVRTPAAVRFVSAEPLLGPLDITKHRPGANQLWIIIGGESGSNARACHAGWIRSIVKQGRDAGVPVFVKQVGANVIDRNDRLGTDRPPASNDWPEPECGWDDGSRGNIRRDLDGSRDGYQGAPIRILLRDRKGGDPTEWPEDLRVREWPEARA